MKSKNLSLKLELDEQESIRLQLDLILNYTYRGVVLNSTQLIYLSYFVLYGIREGKKKMVEEAVSLNAQVWSNHLTIFRNLGILQGVRDNTILNPKIKIEFGGLYEYTLQIKPKHASEVINTPQESEV